MRKSRNPLIIILSLVCCLAAASTAMAEAEVPDGPSACTPTLSDEFDGPAWDQNRWSYRWQGAGTLPPLPTVSGGNLNFQLGTWNVDTNRTGPMHFIGQPLPAGNWTATAKISAPNLQTDATSTGTLQYAQTGIMVYQGDDNWVKVDRTRNADGTPPGSTHTQFESATELAGTRQLGTRVPASPGLAATTDPPGNFWGIRLSNTGGTLSGEYTLNPDAPSPTWTTIPWPAGGGGAAMDTIMPPANGPRYLGLFGGSGSIVTQVDYFRITPDEPIVCEDTTPPVVSGALTPALPDGNNGWRVSATSVVISATDDVSDPENITIEWRPGASGDFIPYTGSIHFGDGSYLTQFRATDEAGNTSEIGSVSADVDATPPTVEHSLDPASGPYVQPGPVTLTLSGSDAISGVGQIEYDSGSGWAAYNPAAKPQFSAVGNYSVAYRAIDNAGNLSAVGNAVFEILDVLPPEPAALKISGKKKATFKGKKAGKVKLKVENTGGTDATEVKLCVKAPKKKVKTKKCINLGTIAPGASKSKSLSFKAQKKFVGKKFSAKAKVTVTAKSGGEPVIVTYDLKLNKKV